MKQTLSRGGSRTSEWGGGAKRAIEHSDREEGEYEYS